jgi:hypothetical protein
MYADTHVAMFLVRPVVPSRKAAPTELHAPFAQDTQEAANEEKE